MIILLADPGTDQNILRILNDLISTVNSAEDTSKLSVFTAVVNSAEEYVKTGYANSDLYTFRRTKDALDDLIICEVVAGNQQRIQELSEDLDE